MGKHWLFHHIDVSENGESLGNPPNGYINIGHMMRIRGILGGFPLQFQTSPNVTVVPCAKSHHLGSTWSSTEALLRNELPLDPEKDAKESKKTGKSLKSLSQMGLQS